MPTNGFPLNKPDTPLITYPFSFAAFVPLFFFATIEIHSNPVDSIMPAVFGSVAGAAVIFVLLRLIGRNSAKAGLLTLIAVCLFYTLVLLEPLQSLINDIPTAAVVLWSGLIFLCYFVIRTPKSLLGVTGGLNKACLVLLALEVCIIGIHSYQSDMCLQSRVHFADEQLDSAVSAPAVKPDVYYIILDGCASERTYKDLFGYDMSPFTDSLRKDGFLVPRDAHSNYAMTELSLPSFLNMSYLDQFLPLTGGGTDVAINNYVIRNNRLARILKRCGYKFINIGSGFAPTWWNPYADENLEGSWISDPMFMLVQRTLFGAFTRDYLIDELRHIRLQQLVNLDRCITKPGPKFVFMHILLPHPPYFFDKAGRAIKPEGAETDWTSPETKSHKSYLNQSIYTMSRVLQFVDHLKSSSRSPYVVIVHGDHGSATTGSLTSDTISNTYANERMGIFLAVFFPNPGRPQLSDSVTPVNVSRIMFDSYFSGKYPILPNRSYMSSYLNPAKLTDVTDEIRLPVTTPHH